MSIGNYDEGTIHRPEQGAIGPLPKPFPWCLACGYQHPQADHCEDCNGDHSPGYCMTDELAAELVATDDLRQRVELEADHLVGQLLHILRPEGSER
jgi:hypothetical protein